MKISVFTPIHRRDDATIRRALRSLEQQTVLPYEWVIVLNGEAANWDLPIMKQDLLFPIFVFDAKEHTGNIGALKAFACEKCTGDVLVELDYDDELVPHALEEIASAFHFNPELQFVYSDSVEMLPDGTNNVYHAAYGWQHNQVEIDGRKALANVAFPEQAHYMRRIEWAPNHVRAFRTEAYRAVGGHAPLPVGDDHDLVCRFYIAYGERGFMHIPDTLYIYHIHPGNTSNAENRNAEIQAQVDANYCAYAEEMYKVWALDNKHSLLDLGGGINPAPGYLVVDIRPGSDIVQDLNAARWDIPDDSVGVIRAYHVLEHLDDPINFFNECYRILAPGGFLLIEVPSAEGAGAFSDPTHKRFFNLLSFEYFTNKQNAPFIQPAYTGRFQKARVVQYWWDNPKIPVISAQLIALKGWYDQRWCGLKEM